MVMGRTSGSSAVFSCSGGFGINGSRVLRCLDDGPWSAAPPTCVAVTLVTCPELSDPMDGTVSMGSRNLNGVATYRCASGYNLEGVGLRICLVSEKWSGAAPSCQRESHCGHCDSRNFIVIDLLNEYEKVKFPMFGGRMLYNPPRSTTGRCCFEF